MAKAVLMDEFHFTVFAPTDLRTAEYTAIRRTLDGARFRAKLARALRDVIRPYPQLNRVRITITR